MKSFLQYLINRIFNSSTFYYSWEERAYLREQEQMPHPTQITCRFGRDSIKFQKHG